MIKTAKVTKCQIQSKWLSPTSNKYVYYHEIHFDNGDKGVCGRMAENPDDMKIGCSVEYDITNEKIKFIKSAYAENNGYNKKDKKSFGYKKNPDDFLGYAYSYAKDMVIAGKTSKKNVDDLKKIAQTIYSHVIELLKKEESELVEQDKKMQEEEDKKIKEENSSK